MQTKAREEQIEQTSYNFTGEDKQLLLVDLCARLPYLIM